MASDNIKVPGGYWWLGNFKAMLFNTHTTVKHLGTSCFGFGLGLGFGGFEVFIVYKLLYDSPKLLML